MIKKSCKRFKKGVGVRRDKSKLNKMVKFNYE